MQQGCADRWTQHSKKKVRHGESAGSHYSGWPDAGVRVLLVMCQLGSDVTSCDSGTFIALLPTLRSRFCLQPSGIKAKGSQSRWQVKEQQDAHFQMESNDTSLSRQVHFR